MSDNGSRWSFSLAAGLTYGMIPVSHIAVAVIAVTVYFLMRR